MPCFPALVSVSNHLRRAWERRDAMSPLRPRHELQLRFSFNLGIMSAALFAHSVAHAQYASSLVNYVQGTGASAGYDNPTSALGEPSRVTSGPFGGPVDPFAPAYQRISW